MSDKPWQTGLFLEKLSLLGIRYPVIQIRTKGMAATDLKNRQQTAFTVHTYQKIL